MPTWSGVVAVAAGSALGGVARYLCSLLFAQRFGIAFPYGTLFVNLSGAFLIGVVVELSHTRALGVTPPVRLALATGVLGGYTTFSAFAYETYELGAQRDTGVAAAYAAGSVVLGLVAFAAGTALGRLATRAAGAT